MPRFSRYHSANRLGLWENKNTPPMPSIRFIFFLPDSNFVAVWIVKVRKLALVRIFFGRIGQESFTFAANKLVSKLRREIRLKYSLNIIFGASAFFRTDAKEKRASGGVELVVISPWYSSRFQTANIGRRELSHRGLD